MFEHSVKVPRHYKVAASILKKVSTEGGSVKSLLYDDKLRHFRTNVLYALITETIKHASFIDRIFESCKILENEARLDPWLAKVLASELLFGKQSLPGKSKPEQTVLTYKDQFERYTSEHQDELKTEAPRRPRYVRVNTNLFTTSDAIRAFQDEGYRFIRCTSGSYDDYLKQIQELTEDDFTQDYHVKTMFVFSSGTKLHEHELYLENKIILQDKATAMAVHLLAPPSGSVVLDMCAAPGMKTTQLAAYMRNTGKIYAVERNEKRFQTLCDFVLKSGSKCVETIHKDALEIKKGEMDDVEYILLDPSCSGSGMDFCVHNYIESTRLAKLTSLQEKFLKHAMNSFPKAKRIVYSTCSIYPEENERVITNVVKTSRAKWRVQDVKELLKGQWNNFGSAMYGSMGTRCMYAKPESDHTTGFFLAILDRDQKDMDKHLNNNDNINNKKGYNNDSSNNAVIEADYNDDEEKESEKPKKKKKKRKAETDDGLVNVLAKLAVTNEVVATDAEGPKKKKKKHKNDETYTNMVTNIEHVNNIDLESDSYELASKKKKNKHNDNLAESNIESENINNIENAETDVKKKKRKKDKTDNISEGLVTEVEVDSAKKKRKDRKEVENLEQDMVYEPDPPIKKKKTKYSINE